MKYILTCFSFFFIQSVISQLLINGADFIAGSTSIIYVNNDSLLVDNNATFLQNGLLNVDKDLISESGSLLNDGEINVLGNVIINDLIEGISNNSQYFVAGNWINNNSFIAGQSTVTLNGTTQDITGSEVTNFYNLTTLGSLQDKKQLVGINAEVTNVLNLDDVEFATNNYNLSVLNNDINSILRNEGFVSSLDTGKLERATNSTNTYLFPTGSTDGLTRYRPIEITPNSSNANIFGVRLANLDASLENFNILNLSDSLCAINPNFYHRIYGNSSADISMLYIPQDDGEWDAMGQWQGTDEWGKLPNEITSSPPQFSNITVPNWSDFTIPAFALALKKPFLDLDDELMINPGESANISPVYQGVNPQSIIWTPLDQITCTSCLETEVNPLQSTQYNIEIRINDLCTIRDSTLVLVRLDGLYLPSAFSPNQDGTNDSFRPLNKNIESFSMSIYNRWGELIYKSNNHTIGWDGTYKGRDAELGVYTYVAEYSFINQSNNETQSGNVTLIR